MLENARFLHVHVDSIDISNGEPRNGDRCPIRQALHRSGFNAPKVPWNGKDGFIRLTDPTTGVRYEWDIPPIAFKWLTQYDAGKPVTDLDFRLDVDKAIKKLPAKRALTASAKTAPKTAPNPKPKRIPTNKMRPIEEF